MSGIMFEPMELKMKADENVKGFYQKELILLVMLV